MYIVILAVILIIIFLSYKLVFKEHFTNIKEIDIEDGVIYYDHTIEPEEKDLVKYLVTLIVEDINNKNKSGKKLEVGKLERLIKKKISDNETEYSVRYFIYNDKDSTNKKYLFDITLNTDTNELKVNAIKGGPSAHPVIERQNLSERGATLFKPKEQIEPNPNDNTNIDLGFNILSKEEQSTDTHYVDNPKDMNKNINLDKANEIQNSGHRQFPSRQAYFEWDTFGISTVEPPKTCMDGILHGNCQLNIVASYNPTLFTGTDEEYEWLFDLASDSASRPVGITGARG